MKTDNVRWRAIPFAIVILIVLAGSKNLFGQTPAEKLNRYFSIQQKKEPLNGVVLVRTKGRTIFERAFGYASVEYHLKNSLLTRFPIGSITKPFIAASILMLEQKNLLSVHDKVRKYLPEIPDSWQGMSIEHLLSHSSGIADYGAQTNFDTLKYFETDNNQLLQRIIQLPLISKAGESYQYSNSNYVLLTCIIERITQSTVDNFMQEEICKPLGLNNTFFPKDRNPVEGLATGYIWQDKLLNADHIDFSNLSGSGGMISTAGDLSVFIRAIMKSRLLPKAAVDKMITPIREEYGYSWTNRLYHNRRLIGHSGRIDGYCAQMWYEPKEEISVVYLSNVFNGNDRVVWNIYGILWNDPDSPNYNIYEEIAPVVPYHIPLSSLDEYTGAYTFRDQMLRVTKIDGKLYIMTDAGNEKSEMIPYDKSKFWVGGPGNITVTFVRDTLNQRITKAEIVLNGTPMTAQREGNR
jgi:CubicO group peptidase (beta-lactamase class C family)